MLTRVLSQISHREFSKYCLRSLRFFRGSLCLFPRFWAFLLFFPEFHFSVRAFLSGSGMRRGPPADLSVLDSGDKQTDSPIASSSHAFSSISIVEEFDTFINNINKTSRASSPIRLNNAKVTQPTEVLPLTPSSVMSRGKRGKKFIKEQENNQRIVADEVSASKTFFLPQDVIRKNLARSRFSLPSEGDGELYIRHSK